MKRVSAYLCPTCGEASFEVIIISDGEKRYYEFIHPDKECKYEGDKPPEKFLIKFGTKKELKRKLLEKSKELNIEPDEYSFILYKKWVNKVRKMLKESGIEPFKCKVAFIQEGEIDTMPDEFWEITNVSLKAQLLREAMGVDMVLVYEPGLEPDEFYAVREVQHELEDMPYK